MNKPTIIALSIAFLLAIGGTVAGSLGFNGEEDNVALRAVSNDTKDMLNIAYYDSSSDTYYISNGGTKYWAVPMGKVNGKWKAESVQVVSSLPVNAS